MFPLIAKPFGICLIFWFLGLGFCLLLFACFFNKPSHIFIFSSTLWPGFYCQVEFCWLLCHIKYGKRCDIIDLCLFIYLFNCSFFNIIRWGHPSNKKQRQWSEEKELSIIPLHDLIINYMRTLLKDPLAINYNASLKDQYYLLMEVHWNHSHSSGTNNMFCVTWHNVMLEINIVKWLNCGQRVFHLYFMCFTVRAGTYRKCKCVFRVFTAAVFTVVD